MKEEGRQCLILSDRIEHLQNLKEKIDDNGKYTSDYYIGGKTQKKLDEASKAQILLGSYGMASEGLDIPQGYKITTTYKNTNNGNTRETVDYINLGDISKEITHVEQSKLNRNVRIAGLNPIPIQYISGNSRLSKDAFFREQKRLLEIKHTEELLKLESQRVYSHLL